MSKKIIMLGMFMGSIAGGYFPLLWGADAFSFTSIVFSGIGGLLGIYVGFKLSQGL